MKRRFFLAGVTTAFLAVTACSETVTGPVEDGAPRVEDGTPRVAASHMSGRPGRFGESQDTVDLTRGFTYAIYPEDQGQILAQTFTTQSPGWLRFVYLPVGCSSGVLLKIRIREGLDGPILSDFNYTGLPEIVDGSFVTFQVFDPAVSHGIRLKNKNTYAIEASAVPTDPNGPNTCGMAPGPVGDSYPRGDGFYEDVPINGPGWVPLGGGEDLPFKTLVF